MGDIKVVERHIADYKQDPNNARRHNPRNLGVIEDSLHAVGAARSLVADEGDVILAGNGTIEAAAAAGIERVIEIETDGHALIIHKRTGLSAEQKIKLALADNRATDLSEWDENKLRELAKDSDQLLAGLFSEKEVVAFMAAVEGAGDVQEAGGDTGYRVVIMCASEAEQQATFDTLTGQGYVCKTVET